MTSISRDGSGRTRRPGRRSNGSTRTSPLTGRGLLRILASPSARSGPGWGGRLLVRQPGRYRWHAFLSGTIQVNVDGRRVLTAKTDKPGWASSEEIELGFGEKPLEVSYSRVGTVGRVMLFWSSDHFPLEPLPGHLLFLPKSRGDLSRVDLGRRLVRSHRCNRCHVQKHDPTAPAAPDLSTVTVGTASRSLVEQIFDPAKSNPRGRMPHTGMRRDEATAIVGWLRSTRAKVELLSLPKSKKADQRRTGRPATSCSYRPVAWRATGSTRPEAQPSGQVRT
ncbi:MAG: hypothetical protein Ct9H300mP1_02470 [Planctomycetaceae bacterium]|nr:MAG: hypothetical protein Ct9H300mP1_02470 [Planctomycetaceae bacterium]